jgi:hypothetical protein
VCYSGCCWCRYKKLWDQDKNAYIRRYEKAQKPLSSYEADVSGYMNKEVCHSAQLNNRMLIHAGTNMCYTCLSLATAA